MPTTHQNNHKCCIKRKIARKIEFRETQVFCKADAAGCHKDISRDVTVCIGKTPIPRSLYHPLLLDIFRL